MRRINDTTKNINPLEIDNQNLMGDHLKATPKNHSNPKILEILGNVTALRSLTIDALRIIARHHGFSERWRDEVHWPIVQSLMSGDRTHRVQLKCGLQFDITAASVIEKNVLISPERHPDHIWEPYTTKLLVLLARGKRTIVVGGAYIGDQVLPIAREIRIQGGIVYAFEPMERSCRMLKHNCELNAIENVVAERVALWDRAGENLTLSGTPALAKAIEPDSEGTASDMECGCETTTIDGYLQAHGCQGADLIMLDLEGGELRALQGATHELSRAASEAPNVVFEIHANYVDWSQGVDKTDIVRYLEGFGYTVYGVRDYHNCYPVPVIPPEIIPAAIINTDGPPHGFNMLATKRPEDLMRLGAKVILKGGPRERSPKLLLRELHA